MSEPVALPQRTRPDIAVVRADPLAEELRQGRLEAFQAHSPFTACLMPLLNALGWRGDPRVIVEALPHFAANLDLDGLRNVLAELSFATKPYKKRPDEIDPRLLPCLHVSPSGAPRVLLSREGPHMRVFDAHAGEEREVLAADVPLGSIYLIETIETSREENAAQASFMSRLLQRFRPILGQLALLTLFTDLLALAFPLFSMAVFDKVVGTQSRELLLSLAVGMAVVFLFDFLMRLLRGRLLAYVGARIERLISVAVLRHLLRLPTQYLEGAPVGTQLARLKEFESVREFFNGPLAGVALDLPFLFVFLIAIGLLGGPLVWVPLVLGLLLVVSGYLGSMLLQAPSLRASKARSQRHALSVEIVSNLRAIKQIGGADAWLERYRAASASAVGEGRKVQATNAVLQTFSQGLTMLAGAIVLVWGAARIIDAQMSVGALVATMALTWRVLSPLQVGIAALSRLTQIRQSLAQIDQLLRLRPELTDRATPAVVQRVFRGQIALNRVSLRYRAEAEPALLGVDFVAKPGEMVGFAGHSGAGKSTALKVMMGLYQPQAGTVQLDGLDIRQMTPAELRLAIAYAPQSRHLFYGTIAQNLRLAAPTASTPDLHAALAEAGGLEEVLALKDGLDTQLGDQGASGLPAGLLQRIALARVFLRPAAVLLLDEPGQWLDTNGDAALIAALQRRKGKQTIILISHRPSHLALCDRVATFDGGRIVQMRANPSASVPGAIR
ncbi:MAG: ABC transporter transmembrane domain-containing protein [Magnetospirillum sp.]|jgi:ATP-binding cassette subfamily C protein LapB|nr:ABC transporter transmembrane domain-containing protein [Magnetospirillum sp.]